MAFVMKAAKFCKETSYFYFPLRQTLPCSSHWTWIVQLPRRRRWREYIKFRLFIFHNSHFPPSARRCILNQIKKGDLIVCAQSCQTEHASLDWKERGNGIWHPGRTQIKIHHKNMRVGNQRTTKVSFIRQTEVHSEVPKDVKHSERPLIHPDLIDYAVNCWVFFRQDIKLVHMWMDTKGRLFS